MTFLDQLPSARNMPSTRHGAARRQLMQVVASSSRSWWHLGRSATIALVIGLMVTGSAAAGVLSSPTPTTIPSQSAAITPPPGAQSPSSVVIRQAPPLVPRGAPAVISAATRACTTGDVIATMSAPGPYNYEPGMGQEIVSLSATSPCYVSGYETLAFSGEAGATNQVNVVDGGYSGALLSVSSVSLGSSNVGSFLFQYSDEQYGTSSCPEETSLSVDIPSQSLAVRVNLRDIGLMVCGTVYVSPIIQGDSVDRYVP
jgi:hypothetical protein